MYPPLSGRDRSECHRPRISLRGLLDRGRVREVAASHFTVAEVPRLTHSSGGTLRMARPKVKGYSHFHERPSSDLAAKASRLPAATFFVASFASAHVFCPRDSTWRWPAGRPRGRREQFSGTSTFLLD